MGHQNASKADGPGRKHIQVSPSPRDALERKGPRRRPQQRLGRRLEEVAEAVGGSYCRLQMPFKLALAVRGTVAEHRLGALEGGVWHKASGSGCLPLAAPIGLLPLHVLTLCGPERVFVVSTEPLDDLSWRGGGTPPPSSNASLPSPLGTCSGGSGTSSGGAGTSSGGSGTSGSGPGTSSGGSGKSSGGSGTCSGV